MTSEEMNRLDMELAEWPMQWKYIPPRKVEIGEHSNVHYSAGEWVDDKGNHQLYDFEWHPTSDPKQAFMVAKATRKEGWWIQIDNEVYVSGKLLWIVIYNDYNEGNLWCLTGKESLCEAICLATKAVKDSRSGNDL